MQAILPIWYNADTTMLLAGAYFCDSRDTGRLAVEQAMLRRDSSHNV